MSKHKPFVFYADGTPVRIGDKVMYRGTEFEVFSMWIDNTDNTNVSLFIDGEDRESGQRLVGHSHWRVNSRKLERVHV